MNRSQFLCLAVVASLLASGEFKVRADLIYDNAQNDLLARFNPGAFEVGDEIQLSGGARYLTNFAFEFWGETTGPADAFAGGVTARVRFYENDGPAFHGYATPGSIFYDSGWFNIEGPTPRNTLV